jgi:hypothetical protein
MHFETSVRTWRVACLYSVQYSEIAISRKLFGIGHMYMYTLLLRMTDTMTSQNIDLSSRNILHNMGAPGSVVGFLSFPPGTLCITGTKF